MIKDIKQLPWIPVADWSQLPATSNSDHDIHYRISSQDFDAFLENLYKDISRKLNMPYKKLKRIIKKENVAFYKLKRKVFYKYEALSPTSSITTDLQNTLRVPDTSFIEKDDLTTCLKLFNNLSTSEKLSFFEKVGKINIEIEYLDDVDENF